MPEDPIAPSEIAALTRRHKQHAEQTNDALRVIKSDVLDLRPEVGTLRTRLGSVETQLASLDTRLDLVERSVNGLRDEVRSGNARIIELLTNLVGKDPSTN